LAKLQDFYHHVQTDRNHMGIGNPEDKKLNKVDYHFTLS
jgi:hypothetical protein